MDITAHALKRCRQRGIPENLLEIVQSFGRKERRPHGAIRRMIKKKDCDQAVRQLKHLIQKIEKLSRQGVCVIMTEDDESVITAYRKV